MFSFCVFALSFRFVFSLCVFVLCFRFVFSFRVFILCFRFVFSLCVFVLCFRFKNTRFLLLKILVNFLLLFANSFCMQQKIILTPTACISLRKHIPADRCDR